MSGRVGIEASSLEPVEREELDSLLDPLLSRLGVKPGDVLAVNVTPARVTLRLKVRQERGRALPHAWAHIRVDVLEGVADDA
jgi:hypothetical protein